MSKQQNISQLPVKTPTPPLYKAFFALLIGGAVLIACCAIFFAPRVPSPTPTPVAEAQQESPSPAETSIPEPSPTEEAQPAAIQVEDTPRPTVTPVPTRSVTDTPRPTATPAPPTNTPAPTDTPLPPTATFTPEPPTATPAPVILSGSGDGVVDIPGTGPMIAKISNSGETSNFAIEVLDSNNELTDLLVNVIGAYQGIRPLNLEDTQAARFQISASAPWSIELLPLEASPVFVTPGEYSGNGDQVLLLDGTSELATINGNSAGSNNFAVWAYGGPFPDLLVNEIDPYQGQMIVDRTNFILVIEAVGPWSIKME